MKSDPVSTNIGKYQLIAEIGRGGMSTVYVAVMRGMIGFNKLFVIKLLRETCAGGDELDQFMKEVRLAARLNHANVVQSLEVGEDEGRYYIAMEYLEGQPLSRLARYPSDPPFPVELHLKIIADALAGLHYAHELADYNGTPLNIVHRDASPHNIFVTYDGVVKLLDFGIAKASGLGNETRNGVIKGKIRYMAPEQLCGGHIDRRVDIFGMGVMLWEAVAQRRLWKGQTEIEIMRHLVSKHIPSPKTVRPDVPDELDALCTKALQFDPDGRHNTALELRQAIENYLATTRVQTSGSVIGEYVSRVFASEQNQIRNTIQKQLAEIEAQGAASSLPVMLPSLTASGHTASRDGSDSRPRQGLAESGMPTGAIATVTNHPEESAITSFITRRPLAWLALTLVVIVVALPIIRGRMVPHTSGASNTAALSLVPETAKGDPPQVQADPQATAEITFQAIPPDARLYLDNAPLPRNPAVLSLPQSSVSHQIRAEAEGYVAKTEMVVIEGNQTVTLRLERASASTRSTSGRGSTVGTARGPARHKVTPESAPAPVATPTPAAAPKPALTNGKSKRDVDDSNPFRTPRPIEDTNPF